MTIIRRAARRVHDNRVLNLTATTVARSVLKSPPSWLTRRVRRLGLVDVDLPGGGAVRLWSEGDDWIASALWWRGFEGYEPEATGPFLRLARAATVVLDVGSYTGWYALIAAVANPAASVYAFEPVPFLAQRIRGNIALNAGVRVEVVEAAVAAESAKARSFHVGGPGLPSSSSLHEAWRGLYRSMDVTTTSLDDFVAQRALTPDLVKLDVEAAEPDVIRGMATILRDARPTIIAEVFSGVTVDARDAYEVMRQTLVEHDYRLFVLSSDGPVETRKLEPNRSPNHLLVPAERMPSWLPS